ncbi:MAG: hypothetical protein R3B09_02910 [Nannocystaceae bacterium]
MSAPPTAPRVLRIHAHAPEAALYELLMLLFEADELRVWLGLLPGGDALVGALPGAATPKSTLCFEAADLLRRRGHVDAALFDALRRHAPRRAALVTQVQGRWG